MVNHPKQSAIKLNMLPKRASELSEPTVYVLTRYITQFNCPERNVTAVLHFTIKRRMAITRSAMDRLGKIWRNRNITKATKMRLVRALVFPIFLYGAETWTIRESERKKIDALEMWCWRRMHRLAWTQFRTNVSILEELDIKQRLSSIVQGRILTFFTRPEDMSVERLVGRYPSRGESALPPVFG
ncbi:hypothetical protein K1T71_004813 [Dendrolimus kikuchii]|uniref:Uncharacterized protein n=1 Tax=Dendrolimus kikuchii TaxID=765133 RepID=A0ACC1D592_9NEOP|nr:hypothetical protein K1T71_004813 [Dendrolimus kikuchii]